MILLCQMALYFGLNCGNEIEKLSEGFLLNFIFTIHLCKNRNLGKERKEGGREGGGGNKKEGI